MAAKYFPQGDALGRTIQIDGGFEFRVTGVLAPVPRNSEFRFPFLVPFVFGREIGLTVDRWNNSAFTTYVQLAEGGARPRRPEPFLLAGGTAFLVALLTVAFHSVRSARANPAGAQRYE